MRETVKQCPNTRKFRKGSQNERKRNKAIENRQSEMKTEVKEEGRCGWKEAVRCNRE